MADNDILFPFSSLWVTETAFPPIEQIGSNVKQVVVAFDDTTQEYRNGTFKVPDNVDTTGTVTFRVVGRAATAAASKTVEFDFDHLALADGEAGDPSSPYTTESSGALSIDSTQDDDDILSWTETIANLGWAAGDEVAFRISRNTGANDNLTGDYYGISFLVAIPVI